MADNQHLIEQKQKEIDKLRDKIADLQKRVGEHERKGANELAQLRDRQQNDLKQFIERQKADMQKAEEQNEKYIENFKDQIDDAERTIERTNSEIDRLQRK